MHEVVISPYNPGWVGSSIVCLVMSVMYLLSVVYINKTRNYLIHSPSSPQPSPSIFPLPSHPPSPHSSYFALLPLSSSSLSPSLLPLPLCLTPLSPLPIPLPFSLLLSYFPSPFLSPFLSIPPTLFLALFPIACLPVCRLLAYCK